jgi:arabinan endo-1,5-alpha-L-arabinosidase
MLQAQQKWVIAPVAGVGGYPGAPYFRITIDQLVDGTYRISPKSVPDSTATWALSAVGSSTPTLSKFDPASDRQRWLLGAP